MRKRSSVVLSAMAVLLGACSGVMGQNADSHAVTSPTKQAAQSRVDQQLHQESSAQPVEMLSQRTTIVLKVVDFASARQSVIDKAGEQGAVLLGAHTGVNEKGRKNGWLQFKIAPDRWRQVLPAIYGVGKLYSDKVESDDHVTEYDELARRITSLRLHEKRLESVLESPRRMRGSDILYLQERLFRANVDEGLLSQRRIDLERNANVSNVQVNLFEPGAEPAVDTHGKIDIGRWFSSSVQIARGAFYRLVARGATCMAYAVVYAPIVIPIVIFVLLILRSLWIRRMRFARAVISLLESLRKRLSIAWASRNRRPVDSEGEAS